MARPYRGPSFRHPAASFFTPTVIIGLFCQHAPPVAANRHLGSAARAGHNFRPFHDIRRRRMFDRPARQS